MNLQKKNKNWLRIELNYLNFLSGQYINRRLPVYFYNLVCYEILKTLIGRMLHDFFL